MVRVLGVDHISIRVSDFQRSKRFYAGLLKFLGFVVEGEYEDAAGWHNGKTVFWIGQADPEGMRHPFRLGDIGLHHYAFELGGRGDVDELYAYLRRHGIQVVDLPGEYYPDYYAVYFLDPDGIKLEGMFYGKPGAKKAKPKKKPRGKTKRGK
jgi:catechol 2,3-dioxygenase-like lactoylglutathione lyase family enzyme